MSTEDGIDPAAATPQDRSIQEAPAASAEASYAGEAEAADITVEATLESAAKAGKRFRLLAAAERFPRPGLGRLFARRFARSGKAGAEAMPENQATADGPAEVKAEVTAEATADGPAEVKAEVTAEATAEVTAQPVAEVTAEAGAAPSPRRRSRLVATALSFLWPGLGQLYARRFITAALFTLPLIVGLVWLVALLVIDWEGLVLWFGASLLDTSFCLSLVAGAVLFGLWRLASMAHAFLTAGPVRRPRRMEAGVLAVLLLVVVAVHAEAAYYAWSFYTFDVDVSNNVLADSKPTETPSATATPSPTPTPLPWQPGSSFEAATPAPDPTVEPPASHHITMMLAGLDWLPGRRGGQYDALMLVSLDTDTNKVVMVSFPRDTAYFDYYWGGRTGVNTKINNFANLVERNQIHAPAPPAGMPMSKYKFVVLGNELGYLAGIKVDYYAVIDMQGFINLVDVAGGVCFTVPKAVVDPSQHTSIGAGYQCMSGTTALKYARSRHGSNDYQRANRQQLVIAALARKIASTSGIARLPRLLSLGSKIIQTNFPLNTAKDYVGTIRKIGAGDITNCVLGPPYDYHPATSLSRGAWTSRLLIPKVANLSVYLYGTDSRYYGMEGVVPAPCPKL
jgi:LCP family protein required for cell wall assembly